jgi:hypothetical protein
MGLKGSKLAVDRSVGFWLTALNSSHNWLLNDKHNSGDSRAPDDLVMARFNQRNFEGGIMMRFILAATLLLTGAMAFAGELDNEAAITNKELKGTVVLRVDSRTHEASYVQTATPLSSQQEAKALAKSAKFAKVPAQKMKSELDQDGGASSWYFYQPYAYNYYQPNCYYYGYYYQPYYTYSYGYYNYYYYNSWWSYGRY